MSCTPDDVTRDLQQAATIAYEFPDSILTISHKIKALDYLKCRKPADKARKMYCDGMLLKDENNYPAALICFLKAVDYAEKTNEDILKGEIYSSIGETYGLSKNYTDELLYSQKALKYFIDCGYGPGMDKELLLLANAFHHNRMYEMADRTYSLVDSIGDNVLPAFLGKAGNALRLDNTDANEVVRLFDKAIGLGASLTYTQRCQYAYALLKSGDLSASEIAQSKLEGEPRDAESFWWLSQISKIKGGIVRALDYLESYYIENQRAAQDISSQYLYKAQIEYEELLARKAKSGSKVVKLWSSVAVILALLALLIVFLLHKQVAKDKDLLSYKLSEANKLLELAKDNESKKQEAEQKLYRLQRSFAYMFKRQLSSVGRMYKTNLSASLIMDEGARRYAQKVSEVLSNISSDKGGYKEFESWVNKELDGIMMKIRDDFPDLDEKTYRFICYVVIGFKDPTIASIFNESISTVSTRKSRLRKRILSASSPNADLYKAFLD